MPASALYHAANAAKSPKKPPAMITGSLGLPGSLRWSQPMPSRRKARSRKKKRQKKATVERRVAIRRMKVNMNQPWSACQRYSDAKGPGAMARQRERILNHGTSL